MKDFFKINDLDSEGFFEFFGFFCIFRGFCICFFFFDINIFELLPLVLGFHDKSFDDISLCWHQFTKLHSFIFKYFYKLINLELRKSWNSIYNTFFFKRGKGKRML